MLVQLVTEDRGAVIYDDDVREAMLKEYIFIQKLGRGFGGLFRNRAGDEELGEMVDSRNNVQVAGSRFGEGTLVVDGDPLPWAPDFRVA